MALFLFVPIGRHFNPNRSLISQNCSLYKITLCINIYRPLFHSQKRKWLMTNDHNDWNSWSLCFTFAASMFHACGLYVSRLRPLSTTHGYDKGRIAFWGARKRLGALAVLCGFERWACKHRAVRRAWNIGAGFVLLDSCFSVVLFVVRAFGRPFRGSCFWSFFGFVLLVVLLWFVLLVRAFGGSYVFFVRCFKILRGVCGKVRGFLMQR